MKRCAYWYAAFSFCHNSAQSMRLTSTTLPLCSQVSFNSDVIIRFHLLIDHACDTEYIGRYASRERCDLGLWVYSSLRMEKVWRPLEEVESGA